MQKNTERYNIFYFYRIFRHYFGDFKTIDSYGLKTIGMEKAPLLSF